VRARAVAVAYALLASLSTGLALLFRNGQALTHPKPWLELDLPTSCAASTILGVAFSAVVVASTRVMSTRFVWASRLGSELRPFARNLTGAQIVLVAALSSLGEELFFRALLTSWLGVIASSAIFGVAHQMRGPSRWWWATWAGMVGLGLGAIFALTGSLLGPLVAHALINGLNLSFLREPDPPRRPRLGGLFRAS
jgi:membrane protease YdiL (CAAX protease family)